MNRLFQILLLGVGLTLFALILGESDLDALSRSLGRIGVTGFAAVLLVFALYFAADALSWHVTLLTAPLTARWAWIMLRVRLIGEVYNNITPTASLGGEPIKALILKTEHNIALSASGASLVIAKTTSMMTLVLFVLPGFYFLSLNAEIAERYTGALSLSLVGLVVIVTLFFLTQWLRLSSRITVLLGGEGSAGRLARFVAGVESVDRAFIEFYGAHPARLFASVAFASLNWALGALELYVILHVVGEPVSFAQAWGIECVVQLVRTATFFIPAGLGTQDGAMYLLTNLLTGNPVAGVAGAVVRRIRDLSWISVGLLVAAFSAAASLGPQDNS